MGKLISLEDKRRTKDGAPDLDWLLSRQQLVGPRRIAIFKYRQDTPVGALLYKEPTPRPKLVDMIAKDGVVMVATTNEQFAALLNQSSEMLWQSDLDGNVLWVNKKCFETFLLGDQPFVDIMLDLSGDLFMAALGRIRELERIDIKCTVICADGVFRWVRIRGDLIDIEGQEPYVSGTIEIICDAKEIKLDNITAETVTAARTSQYEPPGTMCKINLPKGTAIGLTMSVESPQMETSKLSEIFTSWVMQKGLGEKSGDNMATFFGKLKDDAEITIALNTSEYRRWVEIKNIAELEELVNEYEDVFVVKASGEYVNPNGWKTPSLQEAKTFSDLLEAVMWRDKCRQRYPDADIYVEILNRQP